ncbi:MAG: hypothetical protein K940chlam3_00770 [Chlamydiae bacterium]|nr:hypothetical protein [Chlamydiota bacterium]
MNTIKAFMVGIFFPTLIIPFALLLHYWLGYQNVIYLIFVHFIPIIWGIWNVLYFWICRHFLPADETMSGILTGGSLGIVVALIAIYWGDLPEILGLKGGIQYFPLVVAPILYAIIWVYVVTPLNKALGIQRS